MTLRNSCNHKLVIIHRIGVRSASTHLKFLFIFSSLKMFQCCRSSCLFMSLRFEMFKILLNLLLMAFFFLFSGKDFSLVRRFHPKFKLPKFESGSCCMIFEIFCLGYGVVA